VHRRKALGLLAIAALGLSLALVQQDTGPSAASHFALIRSLSKGTAEIGANESIDTSFINGRYYANKAPGLAFTVLPAYVALRAAGLQDGSLSDTGEYGWRVWQLTLVGGVLPAVVLALLMLIAVERITPGYGALAAVLLTAGTLLLPFATLLFGHVLAATLGFAAFVVLLLERQRGETWWRAGAAGLLAGLAIVVEYPLGIVALVLAGYVAVATNVARRLGAYCAGCLVGVTPLLAYNTWAFGSPRTLSYAAVITTPPGEGPPQVQVDAGNSSGFYGVALPDPRVAASLLLSEKGLFVVAPLCVVALLGLPCLWRLGHRAEAAVCAAVPALFLAYNAAYYIPFGGQGPGPRFLVPAIPFLALPLGAALRHRLLPALVVGLASVGVMAIATVTSPLTNQEHTIGEWLSELAHGDVMGSPLWSDGPGGLVPSALLLGLAVALAVASATPREAVWRVTMLALLALPVWAIVAAATPRLLPANAGHGTTAGTLATVVIVAAVALGLGLADRRGPLVALALSPLVLLLVPDVPARQHLALLVALGALALVALVGLAPGVRRRTPRLSGDAGRHA
jgi:hypothetical protein